MTTLLHSRLLAVMRQHPNLARYRREIVGKCCGAPSDNVLRRRVTAFLTKHPNFTDVLIPIVE